MTSTTDTAAHSGARRMRTGKTGLISPPVLPKMPTKAATVLKLLCRAKGATAAKIAEPTCWLPHSVRAYLTALRKKGMTIVREQRKTGESAYRIGEVATAVTATIYTSAEPLDDTTADDQSGEAAAAAEPNA